MKEEYGFLCVGQAASNIGVQFERLGYNVFIEYEVTNLSSKRIIIENKFYDADLTESVFYKDTKEFTGVSNSCYLNAGETILMKCVVVHNHDDLVWYDFKASSLIKLDYKK